ncbi:hypothetical protein D3C72_1271490 [compost metagenome]
MDWLISLAGTNSSFPIFKKRPRGPWPVRRLSAIPGAKKKRANFPPISRSEFRPDSSTNCSLYSPDSSCQGIRTFTSPETESESAFWEHADKAAEARMARIRDLKTRFTNSSLRTIKRVIPLLRQNPVNVLR